MKIRRKNNIPTLDNILLLLLKHPKSFEPVTVYSASKSN